MAVTLQMIKDFFIGDKKFVVNTKDTPVYSAPGSAPFKTVKANDTIGKVDSVNTKGNWLHLRADQYNPTGGYILTQDSLYTVILTEEAPKSIGDAVTRETKKAVDYTLSGINNLFPQLKWILLIIFIVILIALFLRIKG